MSLARVASLAVLLVLLAEGVTGLDFGVVSSTSFGLSSSASAPVSVSERLTGSLGLPFDQNGGGLDFQAHVQTGLLPTPVSFGYDIDALSVTFSYLKPADDVKSLRWTLGRFALSEPTGFILNHPADGSRLAFAYNGFNLSVTGAFTGLVLRSSSGLNLSLADQNTSDALFASPRFIGSLEASLPLFKAHTLTLGALAQQDLNDRDAMVPEWTTVFSGDTGGTLDTQYLTLKIDGPLVGALFYEAFGTFGSGSTLSWLESADSATGFLYEYTPILSFLSGASLSLYLPQVLSSSFTVRVLASSGDPDAAASVEGNTKGDLNLFVPITGSSLGSVFSPGLSNLIFYEMGGTFKPLGSVPLVLGTKVLGFQRAVEGVINAPGVLRDGPVWLGEELDLSATWQLLSDLSVSTSAGFFLPAEGTFASGTPEAGLQYAVQVGVNLSL